jgi:hypothetical protein
MVLKTAAGLTGGSADAQKYEFTVDGRQYIIWAWKGDYINLGAGAETGIYRDLVAGHWETAPEAALPMTLTLQDKSGNVYFDYRPSEDQWWVNGFDPSHQNAHHEDLTSITTIDFSSEPAMWDAFYRQYSRERKSDWTFDVVAHKATLRW